MNLPNIGQKVIFSDMLDRDHDALVLAVNANGTTDLVIAGEELTHGAAQPVVVSGVKHHSRCLEPRERVIKRRNKRTGVVTETTVVELVRVAGNYWRF